MTTLAIVCKRCNTGNLGPYLAGFDLFCGPFVSQYILLFRTYLSCVKLHYIVKFVFSFELCLVNDYALFVNIRTLYIEQ